MRRAIATGFATALLATLAPHSAGAASGVIGYDGKNPFACTLQQLGTGTDFPQPEADPFCVEYDKRHQNATELGVVDFLSQEPARVAAASPKCFYFQRDHWVGSVIQDNQRTQTYAWDGSYFFDKARGIGGVYVENFSFNGQSGDPTALPGFPSQYRPFFGNGRGGIQSDNNVPADPSCVAKAKEHDPRAGGGPGGAGTSGLSHCRVPGGHVRRGIAGIRLGARRSRVRSQLGPASAESLRYVTYCMTGGGRVVAGFDRKGPKGRAVFVYTDAEPFDTRGIRTGGPARKAARRLGHHRTLRLGRGTRALAKREHHQVFLIGVADRRVAFLAVVKRKASFERARRLLKRMPR
ncbi:MAG TPA: hypothetical protein VF545_09775 [Thermoleophilaceae bacterium]|jgi:hypothetical protein